MAVSKISFSRDQLNRPIMTLFTERADGRIRKRICFLTEELYDQWVPDTNHFHGENIAEGIVWEKTSIPNLKVT
jgi:hypothetical protein